MAFIIDRRLNAKNKSTVNRQRFLRRYKEHIKKSVSDAVTRRSITDIESGEQISISQKDIREPIFHHGPGGHQQQVFPGNKEFHQGDKIARPSGGGEGQGAGPGASDSGEGMDDFVFQISQDEFLNFMFEDLALPNLVKRQLSGVEEFKLVRAGITDVGTPGRINIVRSLRSANARRIALAAGKKRKLQELERNIAELRRQVPELRNEDKLKQLLAEAEKIRAALKKIPFLDEFDLKYNLLTRQPLPRSKAVMFCIMDVSGSMIQETKDMAKRFFILLYLFLQRNYQHTDVVFIRHHTIAKEVDEQEFFYSRETGGTIVSSALKLTKEIIDARYPLSEWNIYGAQASDGDNWNDDSSVCFRLLQQGILPLMQHFSYIEITQHDHQALWQAYAQLKELYPDTFAMEHIVTVQDIYPVFRQLFHKKAA